MPEFRFADGVRVAELPDRAADFDALTWMQEQGLSISNGETALLFNTTLRSLSDKLQVFRSGTVLSDLLERRQIDPSIWTERENTGYNCNSTCPSIW